MLGMARNAFSSSRYRSRFTLMKSITLSMRDATPLGGGRGVGADRRYRKLQMKSKSAVVGTLDFERAAVRLHDLTARGQVAGPLRLVDVGGAIVEIDHEAIAGVAEARGERHGGRRQRSPARQRRPRQQRRKDLLELPAVDMHQRQPV